jgi:hypothetical protein
MISHFGNFICNIYYNCIRLQSSFFSFAYNTPRLLFFPGSASATSHVAAPPPFPAFHHHRHERGHAAEPRGTSATNTRTIPSEEREEEEISVQGRRGWAGRGRKRGDIPAARSRPYLFPRGSGKRGRQLGISYVHHVPHCFHFPWGNFPTTSHGVY